MFKYNSKQYVLIATMILLQQVNTATNTSVNLFFSKSSSVSAETSSSQDQNLESYDSANCECDVSYMCDYDCLCEEDSSCTYTDQNANPYTKTTLENDNTLITYPFCATLRSDFKNVVVSQLNTIACLSFENTPYHGYFYSASTTVVSVYDNSLGTFPIYLPTKNLSKSTAKAASTGIAVDPTFKAVKDFKTGDQFGICSVQAYLDLKTPAYSSHCYMKANSDANRGLNVQFVQGSTSSSATVTVAKETVAQDKVQIRMTSTPESASQESGYSFGDNVSFGSLTLHFGGSYFSSTSLTASSITLDRIKRLDASTAASKQLSVTVAAKTNYQIYYSTLDDSGRSEFQIIRVLAGTLGITQIDFIFVNFTEIAEINSYSDRLQRYIFSLFYPLRQYLHSSILSTSLLLILALYAVIL